MARVWPGICVELVSRWSRLIAPTASCVDGHGKSDPVDAVEAARAAQSGRAFGSSEDRATATWKRSGRWWSPSVSAASSADQDVEPDPPSRVHRPR